MEIEMPSGKKVLDAYTIPLLNKEGNIRGFMGVYVDVTQTTASIGKGREFEKLREYIPGDSYDEIHWKATAKRGRPVTKVFQIERTQEVYVVIDASRLSALQPPVRNPKSEGPKEFRKPNPKPGLPEAGVAPRGRHHHGQLRASGRWRGPVHRDPVSRHGNSGADYRNRGAAAGGARRPPEIQEFQGRGAQGQDQKPCAGFERT